MQIVICKKEFNTAYYIPIIYNTYTYSIYLYVYILTVNGVKSGNIT